MFGFTLGEALRNMCQFLKSVKIHSYDTVNHLIAMIQPEGHGHEIASGSWSSWRRFIWLGRHKSLLYETPLVISNPSVKDFVFEWDIFEQLKFYKYVEAIDSANQTTRLFKYGNFVSLNDFVANKGNCQDKTMIWPKQRNWPEIDGIYVYSERERLNLLTWNASCALDHSGTMAKFHMMLENFLFQGGTKFANVRFTFIIPKDALAEFKKPSVLEAKVLKANWAQLH